MLTLFMAVAMAVGPSTQPATQQDTSESLLKDELKAAIQRCTITVQQTDAYRAQATNVAALSNKLDEARKGGDPQSLLTLSSQYGTANQELKQMVSDAIAADPTVKSLNRQLDAIPQSQQESPPSSKNTPHQHFVLKSGAPDSVVAWFKQQPALRDEDISFFKDEIAEGNKELDQLRHTPIGTVDAGKNVLGGESVVTDPVALRARDQQSRKIQDKINQDKADLRKLMSDPLYLSEGHLKELSVGKFGVYTNPIKIDQIVDGDSLIGEIYGTRVWLRGINTTGLVDTDGAALDHDGPWYVSGTKQYTTVIGSSITCFVLEPLDYKPWIDVIDDSN